jgi:hypothetical protein
MTDEPHDYQEQNREALRKLAADIADLIVNGDMPGPRIEELLAARRVCPPNKLCCWAGYVCANPFFCDEYFRCVDQFSGLRVAEP